MVSYSARDPRRLHCLVARRAQASDSPEPKTNIWAVTGQMKCSASAPETKVPLLLADLLEFGFLFRSDLACVFECFDALR